MPDGSELSHRLDGVTVLGSAVFLGESTMGSERVVGDGSFSVSEFGAVGDGSTDDSAAFQRALNATSASAPRLVVPAGSYKITTGLTCSTPNLEMVGTGGSGQDGTFANGATIILVGSGIVGFTYNPSSASTIFRGPVLRNLMFKDNASGAATGGLLVNRTSNFRVDGCTFAGFTGASSYGCRIDGGAGYSQYGVFSSCGFHTSKTGLDIASASGGHRLVACYFDGNSNAGTVPGASRVGLSVAASHGEVKVLGCVFQFWDTGVSLGASSESNELVGCRFEGCTTCLSIASDFSHVIGGTFSNSIIGGTGTAVSIAATADGTKLVGMHLTAFGTTLSNSGTNTISVGDSGLVFNAVGGVATLVKAGIPADGDFGSPVSGTLAVDTTNSKLYVRVGSTWKSVTVA